MELSALNGSNPNGFTLNGIAADDRSGSSVSGAGDVNGDGLADVLIGAWGADPNGDNSGRSYVVFGKTDGGSVEMSALGGSQGFTLNGAAADNYSGISVSDVGDVNGDGLADILIGAFRADPNGDNSGASYVVFGQAADADGDGIIASEDCDDNNPDVGSAVTYYEDQDGDGFGDPEVAVTDCSTVSGFVTQAGDCNDADGAIYPGAMEVPGDKKRNACPPFISTELAGITAISNLEVTSLSATEIQLTWTSGNDPEATFTIERATNNAFTENVQAFDGITAGSESFTDSSLTAGTVYYYRIRIEKL